MLNLQRIAIAVFLLGIFTSFSEPTSIAISSTPENTIAYLENDVLVASPPPTFSNCPSDMTGLVPSIGNCTVSVNWIPPIASGGLGSLTVSSNYNPGDQFFAGTHRVVYRATDSNGDTAFCTFNITVLDNENPVITAPADIAVSADPGSCGAVINFTYPTASDNCPAGTGESSLEENFDGGDDFSQLCYVFDGTSVGTSGIIDGTFELETEQIVDFDARSFLMPLTLFNGTGEIFFDHILEKGIGNLTTRDTRITISLVDTGGTATQIFSKQYLDENLYTEYIPITQSGNFYVLFEFTSDDRRRDIAYLDNIYVPGFVVANESGSGQCDAAFLRVAKTDGSGLNSGDEFPVGTTTLRYFTEDAAGNFDFEELNITVTNDITPPSGPDVEYCEGNTIPTLTVSNDPTETVDWYDAPSGGTLLLADSNTYTPTGPGDYYVESRNALTGCTSATRTRIRLLENPRPDPPVVVSSIEYCIGDTAVPLTATEDPGNLLEWYTVATGGTMLPGAPTPDTSSANTTNYYVQQVDGTTGCTSLRAQIQVIVYNLPVAPSVTSPLEYCIGETAATLDSSATGTNLVWYDAAVGGNIISGTFRPSTAIAGTQNYWVTQSVASGGTSCESTRAQLVVNVNAPPAITTQPTNQTVCEGENASFTSAASNAVTYQWQLFNGGTWTDLSDGAPYSNTTTTTLDITAATLAMNGNQYRMMASSIAAGCADAISAERTLTVNALPNAPGVTSPVLYCVGDTATQLTATGTNLLWYTVATGGTGSATAPTPSTAAAGSTSYWVSQTNASSCEGPRAEIVVTVNAFPNAPGVTSPVNYCIGDTATQLTASGTNLLWYTVATGGTGSATAPTPNTATAGSTSYWVSQTNASSCESPRAEIVVNVNTLPNAPGVTTPVTYCQNDTASQLTATGTNLLWYTVATGGTGSATAPTPNTATTGSTSYWVSQTNASSCEGPRAEIVVTINAQPSAPGVTTPVTYCEGDTASQLTATGTNLLWYTVATGGTGSATAPTPSTATTGSTSYWVSQTNASSCEGPRAEIVVTVNAQPSAPGVATPVVYCQNDTASQLTATGTNLLWYTAATGGTGNTTAPTPSTSAVGDTSYYVSQTSGTCESPRAEIVVTINAQPTIGIDTAPSCAVDLLTYSLSVNVSTGNVTSTAGTVTDNGGNNWTVSAIPSGTDITITVTDTGNSCDNTINITAPNCSCPTVNEPGDDSGDLAYCIGGTVPTISATVNAGETIDWYTTATGGTAISTGSLTFQPSAASLSNGPNSFYAEARNTANGCTSATRNEIIITQNTLPAAPGVTTPVTYCEGDTASQLTATGTNLLWYTVATGGTGSATAPTPNTATTGSTSYWVSQTNASSCEGPRAEIVVTINAQPSAPGVTTPVTYCEGDTASQLTATGTNLLWYTVATGGTGSATAPTPSTATTGSTSYWVSQTNASSCEGPRAEIVVTVNPIPSAPGVATPVVYCQNDTASQLTATGTNLLWYTAATGGTGNTTAPTPSTSAVGDTSYYVSQTSGTCESPRAEIVVTINAQPTIGIDTAPSCAPDLLTYSLSVNVSTGTVTSTEGNVTDNGGNNWTISGITSGNNITLTVTDTATTCADTMNITAPNCACPTVNAPTVVQGDQAYCIGSTVPTIEVAIGTDETVDWFTAATGGTAVATGTLTFTALEANLVNGANEFYAEARNTVNACTSATRTLITVTQNALPSVVANATATTINAGEPVTLTGSGATTYIWDNGVTDGDTVFPITTTTYTVTGTDGNGCENTAQVTITVSPTSDLRVDKTVDNANPNVGETIVFTLTVFNDGPIDCPPGAVVRDLLPQGFTYVSDNGNTTNGTYADATGDWTLPLISNGNSASITISVMVDAPTGTAGEYTNVAQVFSSSNFDPDSSPNNDDGDQSEDDEAAVTITPQAADLNLTNSISQPSANPGDVVTISVAVQNEGTSDATNIDITNTIPSGFTVVNINDGGAQTGSAINWNGMNIPAGNNVTLTFEVSVNMPTAAAGEYTNTVQIAAVDQHDPDSAPNNDDGDQSEDDEDNTLLTIQSADLRLVNTVNPGQGNPGDILTFTVEVFNEGSDDATNIGIENYVPSGFTVTTINNGGVQNANTISWSGLNIPAGTSQVLTFEVTINVPTNTPNEYVNTAQVTAVDQLDPDSTPNNDDGDQSEDDEDSAFIELIPADLSITKALSAASIQNPNSGDTVIFEITVTNEGPGLATNVRFVDQLPSGFTLGTVNDGGVVSANTITWVLPVVPVGSQTVSYEVTIGAPTNVLGEYTNTVEVTASDQYDPDSTPNNDDGDQSEDDEASYTIPSPTVDLEVLKTVDKVQTFIGDTVLFTITVTNNSTYDATNVGIEDTLPAGYALVSANADTGVYDETIATWEIPSISAGATASLEMTVTVTDIEDYTNIAQLIYVDQIDPNMANDRDEATPEVTQSECLTIFNEFSPNQDGLNDFFFIECIDQYPDNTLQVYNRWGVLVFETKGYDNTWDGTSIGRATVVEDDKLPVGTYYYLLDLGNGADEPKTGWLYISR